VATAREVAAAQVVGHRIAAARRTRPVAGGVDEPPELADGHLGHRHRESTLEADRPRRAFGVGRARLAGRRAHHEVAVRHHHHRRRASAALQCVGETLAGHEQAVMHGEIDAAAQLGRGRVGRRRDAQYVREIATRRLDAARLAERSDAGIAQVADAGGALEGDACARFRDRRILAPHRCGEGEPAVRRRIVLVRGGLLGAADQRALGGGQALPRPRIGVAQRERAAEEIDGATAGLADLATRERGFAEFTEALAFLDTVDLLQEALDIRPIERDHAQHRSRMAHGRERVGVGVELGQAAACLQQQAVDRMADTRLRTRAHRFVGTQCEEDRQRRSFVVGEAAFGEGAIGLRCK